MCVILPVPTRSLTMLRSAGCPLLWIGLLMVGLCPTTLCAQDAPSRTRFIHWGYQDAQALVQQTSLRTPLYLVGAGAFLGTLSGFDTSLNDHVRRLNRGTFHTYLEWTNHIGGPRALTPVAAVFGAALLTRNSRFQDAAFTSLQSLVYTGVLSYGLKYTLGRVRPYHDVGAFEFDLFSGHTSFPSGHTSAAFAILSPWVFYYPHPATYTLFALGTGTALARMTRDKHWATDVMAGAGLGIMVGYWLTRRHQNRTAQAPVQITPLFAGRGLELRWKF